MTPPDDHEMLTKVEALEREVKELRAALESLRRDASMREGRRCPTCGGTKILHVKRIQAPDSMGGVWDLSLVARVSTWTGVKSLAPFSVYTCSACGLVEWYVSSFAEVEMKSELVELLEPDTWPGGPYR
jgi:hypothetical protein